MVMITIIGHLIDGIKTASQLRAVAGVSEQEHLAVLCAILSATLAMHERGDSGKNRLELFDTASEHRYVCPVYAVDMSHSGARF